MLGGQGRGWKYWEMGADVEVYGAEFGPSPKGTKLSAALPDMPDAGAADSTKFGSMMGVLHRKAVQWDRLLLKESLAMLSRRDTKSDASLPNI